MKKAIIVCADDYGQNEFINDGILSLLSNDRINAISCLTNMPAWEEGAKKLKGLQKKHYIGLHFNLTHGQALSNQWKKKFGTQLPTLVSIIKNTYLHRYAIDTVEAELEAQIDAFVINMGCLPDHIDGHQHIHQLPIIRKVLMKLNKKYHLPIRSTVGHWTQLMSLHAFPKRHIIAFLGGLTFNNMLKKNGIPFNSSFSGIYNFTKGKQYHSLFPKFLKQIHANGMIMCHPGLASKDQTDPLSQFRYHEWKYLSSKKYLKDLIFYKTILKAKP